MVDSRGSRPRAAGPNKNGSRISPGAVRFSGGAFYAKPFFRINPILGKDSLGNLYIHRVDAFATALGIERYRVALANVVDQAGDVDENFLAVLRVNDEAEAFGFVEELDGSFVHEKAIEIVIWQLAGTKIRLSK
jgi:hypothetical protein